MRGNVADGMRHPKKDRNGDKHSPRYPNAVDFYRIFRVGHFLARPHGLTRGIGLERSNNSSMGRSSRPFLPFFFFSSVAVSAAGASAAGAGFGSSDAILIDCNTLQIVGMQ